ncbi:MAG: FtsX-like permease family protein [Spirochaetes bacterium]|nr:FtsX-like permease family protein [Spirochaetota bacterium]
MKIGEGFRESWDTITHNKLRTFLTMLGMNIGVAAVIAIMASGLMARSAIMTDVESIGAALLWITPNREAYERPSERTYLKPTDLTDMRKLVEGAVFSPQLRSTQAVSYRGFSDPNVVQGVMPAYLQIWQHDLAQGRFISERDVQTRQKIAVLGIDAARIYFDEANPIGKSLRIGDNVFTVVGVMADRERSFVSDGSDDETIYVPYPAKEGMMDWSNYGGPRVLSLDIQVNDVADLDYTVEILQRFLEARYGTVNGEPRFNVNKAEENIDTFNRIFGIITTVISLIAGISLLVSGIGIMNIMLVTVTERTKEIGIRKAIGAKRFDVLTQFLIEAVIICLIGGGIGIILGVIIAFLVASNQGWQYVMPLYAIVLGIGVSVAIGLFFGIYPATQASRLDPVVALTKE